MATPFVAGGGIQSKSISDFDPRTLSGCMLWLDAADTNTLFTDTAATTLAGNGDLVARWNDKANPGKFVRQDTSTLRPSYVVSSNALPALNFTGVGGDTVRFNFSDTSTPPMPTGTNPATYFVVVKPNLGTASGGFIITYGPSNAATSSERYLTLYGGTSNNLARFAVGSGNNVDVSTGNITQTTILTAVYSDFICSLTTNGGARGTLNVQAGNPSTGTAFYNIGDYYGGSPFYGYINEILVFNRALQNDECQQVEGYLAWKWGVVQNLPTTHPYYYAKAPQTAFQPTNLPSCALWVDGADTNTLSGRVTQWNDKSTNNNHATQATDAKRPTYSNGKINTTSTLLFSTPLSAAPSVEYGFCVFSVSNNISNQNIIFGGVNSRQLYVTSSQLAIAKAGVVNILITGSSLILPNTRYLANYEYNYSSGLAVIYINGSSVAVATPSVVTNNQFTSVTTTSISSDGNGLGGSVFEVLLYNSALNNVQRQQIEGYLAWKWRLVANLPNDHLNKIVSPQILSPTSIAGCQLWLDASDVSSMNLSVTQWNDKSGNRTNLVSNASFLRPTYLPSERSLNFTAVANTSATVLDNTSLPAITSTSVSVFGVYKRIEQASGVTTYQRFISGAAASSDDFVTPTGFNLNTNATNTGITYERNGSLVSTTTNTSPFILSFVLNGTASAVGSFAANTQYIFKDGSQLTSGTGSSNGTAFNIQRIRLGSAAHFTDVSIPTSGYNGTISEVLLFSTILTPSQAQQVEGYLGWKWGLQSNLPATHPYTLANYFFNNTRPMSRVFRPPDIGGCQLWIDASDSSTVTLTTSNVTTIFDKSGLENNVTNSSSILKYTDTLNGLNTITCPGNADNTNNFLTTASLPRDRLNHSYFVVCKYPSANAVVTRMLNMTNHSFGHSFSTRLLLDDNNTNAQLQSTQYAGTDATENAALAGNAYICTAVRQNSVYNIVPNGITSGLTTNSNGTTIGATLENSSTTAYSITPPLNSGVNVGGQLAEVIVYNRALSVYERQIVEGYLAWKWGFATRSVNREMPGNLFPTTHPYASYPSGTTLMLPSTKTHKKLFDPVDLSPVLWFDAQDSSSYTAVNNRLTAWNSKGSNKLQLGSISSVNGPLITKSATISSGTTVSQGTGFQFADFSSGGYFQVTGAELTSTTNLRLTLFPSPHNIPTTRQVTFSQLAGTIGAITLSSYLPNGSYTVDAAATSTIDVTVVANGSTTGTFSGVNGAVEYGNISIASANVTAATTLTITTPLAHGLSASPADTVTLNFTTGTLPSTAAASTLNGTYTVASRPSTTQITITIASQASTGALTGSPVGVLIFPSTGCGLNWTGTPLTSSAGGTLVCVTHLPRTPVRNSTNRNSFVSASTTNGNAAGNDTTSNGRDFKLTLDNTGAAIRKNNGITASIGNTQLTAGFNVMNMTLSNTGVAGTDIATGVNGISVKGWRYDTVLSNSNYNATGGAASSSLSLAQIRVGGNTDATSSSPINSHWYEGGLGDIFFFDRVLNFDERQLLEGWLSQKYGCNNTLGATTTNNTGGTAGSSIHPYRLNPTLITPSNRLDLTSTVSPYAQNLVAWFDAANVNSITPVDNTRTAGSVLNNDRVFSWANLGGSLGTAANLTQATSALQPVFVANAQNGLPGMQFIGDVNSNISATITITQTQLSTYSTNNELTIFTVYRHTDTSSANTYIFNILNTSETRVALQRSYWNINQNGSPPGSSSNFTTTFDPTNETAYINIMRRSGSTMTNRMTGNGTQIITSNSSGNLALTGSFDQICMGHYRSTDTNADQRFKGYFHELVIFRSALTDQDIQQIEGYLAWKWGLQGSLPTRHAYKNVPA